MRIITYGDASSAVLLVVDCDQPKAVLENALALARQLVEAQLST